MAQIQQQNIFQMQQLQQQRHRLIAPATAQSRSSNSLPYAKSSSVYAAGTTLASNNPAVVRRNARERNRVKQVNHGFLNLRQHIPTAIVADLSNGRRGIGPGANKKLSKVDTLRMAVEYIRRLQKVIDDVDNSDASSVSSFNSCGSSSNMSSSSSFGGSPPPSTSVDHNRFYYDQFNQQEMQQQPQQERYYGLSYASAFANQALNTSPVQSQRAPYPSTDSFSLSPVQPAQHNQVQLKFESSYDEYTNASNDDDEELLDYISLWQEDM